MSSPPSPATPQLEEKASQDSITSSEVQMPEASKLPWTPPKQGGFSAEEFSRYERMLRTNERDSTGSTITILETEKAYKKSSDMESGYLASHSRNISTVSTTSVLTDVSVSTVAVPEKKQSKFVRNLRHTSFNVYRRLFSLVFIGNMIGFVVLLANSRDVDSISLSNVATASSANILVAIMIRQDYIVNALFRSCWLIPHSAPLRVRRMLAKIYEHGGVHSGTFPSDPNTIRRSCTSTRRWRCNRGANPSVSSRSLEHRCGFTAGAHWAAPLESRLHSPDLRRDLSSGCPAHPTMPLVSRPIDGHAPTNEPITPSPTERCAIAIGQPLFTSHHPLA